MNNLSKYFYSLWVYDVWDKLIPELVESTIENFYSLGRDTIFGANYSNARYPKYIYIQIMIPIHQHVNVNSIRI